MSGSINPIIGGSFRVLSDKEAVAEIGSALQIARKGAGTNDEAANNLRNFLTKITSTDTVKDFDKAGIDLKSSLIALRKEGMTPMQGMLKLITDYMGKKGPDAAAKLQTVLTSKDESARDAALKHLDSAYKLGELFQDMQAMNFIKPAIAHAQEMADIKKGAMGAGDSDLIGKDFELRMETFNEQAKRTRVVIGDLGISVGSALLPPVNTLLNLITPLVSGASRLAAAFPRATATVIGLAGGLAIGRAGLLAFRYGGLLLSGTIVSGQTVLALFTGKLALFRSAMLAATGATRVFSLGMLANPIGLTVAAIAAGAVLIYKYWAPISGFFKGLWRGVMEVLSPAPAVLQAIGETAALFLVPFKLSWNALKGIGPALAGLFKPVEDVAGSAERMGVRFGRALAELPGKALAALGRLPAIFTGAGREMIAGMGNSIKSEFNRIWPFFQSLPGRFFEWGGQMLSGLIGGVKAKIGAVKDTIVGVAKEAIYSFGSTLEIRSPSRVFQGLGGMVGEGMRLGMLGAVSGVQAAGKGLATAALAGAVVTGGGSGGQALAAQSGGSLGKAAATVPSYRGGQVMNFSYVINVNGGGNTGEIRNQVAQALKISQSEFEKMLTRAEQNRARKGFS